MPWKGLCSHPAVRESVPSEHQLSPEQAKAQFVGVKQRRKELQAPINKRHELKRRAEDNEGFKKYRATKAARRLQESLEKFRG